MPQAENVCFAYNLDYMNYANYHNIAQSNDYDVVLSFYYFFHHLNKVCHRYNIFVVVVAVNVVVFVVANVVVVVAVNVVVTAAGDILVVAAVNSGGTCQKGTNI